MASRESGSAAALCRPSASSEGLLHADVLYDVLLHLPAKTLCRFRAVSRSWRSLLTADPHFAEAHASRHPHVVALFNDYKDPRSHIDTFDLSGNRLRRVTLEPGGQPIVGLCTHGNLACVTRTRSCPNRVCLINLATGGASVLPGPDDADRSAAFMLGQVASSGEHKLVCVLVGFPHHVFVLGLGAGSDRRWRRKESPSVRVTNQIIFAGYSAVVQGTVYCLCLVNGDSKNNDGIYKDSMVSFDLETEEWAPALLPGPLGDRLKTGSYYGIISLSELSGCLVTAHTYDYGTSMDLWFLVEGQWCKRHHIELDVIFDSPYTLAQPLFVFDDGRILLRTYAAMEKRMGLRVYDTRTKTRVGETTDIRNLDAIGVCTGSLLRPYEGT